MTPKGDALDESNVIIREIETGLESSLRQKREQIQRELEDRLRREREESERKLAEIEREFEKERGSLREYHDAVAEFESARDGLEAEIRARLDRSAAFQKEIEKMTSQTGEELRAVAEMSGRLADLRLSAERKIGDLRAKLRAHV
jgi:chromosome segregation ATPase